MFARCHPRCGFCWKGASRQWAFGGTQAQAAAALRVVNIVLGRPAAEPPARSASGGSIVPRCGRIERAPLKLVHFEADGSISRAGGDGAAANLAQGQDMMTCKAFFQRCRGMTELELREAASESMRRRALNNVSTLRRKLRAASCVYPPPRRCLAAPPTPSRLRPTPTRVRRWGGGQGKGGGEAAGLRGCK